MCNLNFGGTEHIEGFIFVEDKGGLSHNSYPVPSHIGSNGSIWGIGKVSAPKYAAADLKYRATHVGGIKY